MNRFENAALILIDIQKGFDDPRWGIRNNRQAESNAGRLLEAWRAGGLPLFHVRHASRIAGSPLSPEGPGFDYKPEVAPQPGEAEIRKSVNSAFIGTDLEAQLRGRGIGTVIVFGLVTPHCVSTTARMAANLGFTTFVASDASAAFTPPGGYPWGEGDLPADPELAHRYALANINGEFATVLTTQEILDELSDRLPAVSRADAA